MSSVVPEGWSRQKLGDYLIPRPKSKLPSGESNPLGYYDFYVCSHKVLKSFHNEYSSPSILFSTGGEASVHLATERYAFSTDVWATEFEGEICNEYVFRLLEENISTINYSGFQGSGIKHLDKSFIEKLEFSIPPLPEQKKIASILTSVDEVIENTQKQIDKLQDLKKATMNELLTKGIGHTEFKDSELGRIPEKWVIAEFGDYFTKLSSGMTPSRSKPDYFNGNIPWVTSGELDYNIITSTRENISEQAVKDTNLKVYPPGTIFIAITGLEAAGTRGRCAILGVPSTVNQSCMAFPVNPDIDSTFFFQNYLLRGEQYAFKYSQGTKQQSFNAEIVKKLPILIPPLSEQKKIASILTSIDKTIEEKQRKLHQTQSLKKSLMQDLLTGKVRVTVN
ncbi:restriction endonuclease subunit S [Bacteroidota bacterium]|nr:restriction endonuclease subunit S [Bacteroidota bacterium]